MFQSEKTIKKTRKHHQCNYCGSTIPSGASCIEISGKFDGEFYTARGHSDCKAMWNEAFKEFGDPYEGMAFDLLDVISGDENFEYLQPICNSYRGRFPHVICRLEYRMQKSDIAAQDRAMAHGYGSYVAECPMALA